MNNEALRGKPYAGNPHARFVFAAAMLMCACDGFSAEPVVYDFTDVYAPYLAKTNAVIWKNRKLADITSITAILKGGWISTPKNGKSCIYDRTDTSFTAQLQCVDGNCKAVRAHFSQVGDDVVAVADGAGYGEAALFRKRMPDSLFVQEISTDGSNGTYGAHDLEAWGDSRQVVKELPESAAGIVVNGGLLQVDVEADTTVATGISGTGGLKLHSADGGLVEQQGTFAGYAPTADKLVVAGGDISTFQVTGGLIQGGWISSGKVAFEAGAYNLVYDAATGTLSVQFQCSDPGKWVKGVAVLFTQKADGIYLKAVKAAQANAVDKLGTDMFGSDWPASGTYIATSDTGNGYGVQDIRYVCRVAVKATLSGEKSWTGGTVVDGANVIVEANRLVRNTDVRVVNGGSLTLNAKGGFYDENGIGYYVGPGSTLVSVAPYSLHSGDRIVVDGGTLRVGNGSNYLNDLTLANGGTLAADASVMAQVGYFGAVSWNTDGTNEVYVNAPVRLVRQNSTLTLDTVADITFGETLVEHPDYKGMKFVKTGAALATFKKSFTATGRATLAGGALAFEASSTFGALVLAGNAAVSVSSGSTLTFADSSAETWTSGATVSVSGTVRFGTSASALTREQQRAIRLDGKRAVLDDDGWLVEKAPGTAILFR